MQRRTEPPTGIVALRLGITILVLGGGWLLLEEDLFSPHPGAGVGLAVEWLVVLVVTVVGLAFIASQTLRLYQSITRVDEES